MNNFRGVFFDLDGTLIDTAPDMGLALNLLLERHHKQPLPMTKIRPNVSHGSAALVNLGFGIDQSDSSFESLKQEFLDIYQANVAVESKLFSGMDRILKNLETTAIPWGIVTNKPAYLTDQLLDNLGLLNRAASVISGDTLAVRKPHPEPLLKACEIASCISSDCLYIGDAERDVEAAKAAGMMSCAALYGYYTEDEDPITWNADYYIDSPIELEQYIKLPSQNKTVRL